MNVSGYLQHVPTIEKWIEESKLDAIVCGMGPTAWLLRWVDRRVLNNVRLFGVHDGCAILPMDDLVIMDAPQNALHPITNRFADIVKSRPKRIWVYQTVHKEWLKHLDPAMHSVTTSVPWYVWHFGPNQPAKGGKLKIDADPPHTVLISPTGAVTLAWREGCRRIGLIGVDLDPQQHHQAKNAPQIDKFLCILANQAHAKGGLVRNLSPITTCKSFREWKPSTFGLEAIVGSETPEPSASSNTASASTQPAQSRCTGGGAATLSGRSASWAATARGGLVARSTSLGPSAAGARRSHAFGSPCPR